MTLDRIINVSAARGESYADILRRTGAFGVSSTDSDSQALAKLNADASASAERAEAARDVAIAAGVQYESEAAAVAGLADGAFGSYLDEGGLPVWGQRDGASMAPIPGPWFDASRVGYTHPGAGAIETNLAEMAGHVVSAAFFGTKADGIESNTAAMTSGSAVLTDASAAFTAQDVGKRIFVRGAGSAGGPLLSTIAAYTSPTQVTLAANAATTVSGAECCYGTDNTAAFNEAIDAVSAAGGGLVLVLPGLHVTTNNVILRDNVYLAGQGYASRIHNIATVGFAKCVVVSGNMGDPANGNSMFDEAGYDFDTVTAGGFELDLISAGDASHFAAGDIICLQSYEKWPLAFPRNHGKYLHQNEVIAISGTTIALRYPVPDDYPSSAGSRPTAHVLSGTMNGYNGQPAYMGKNCGARDLRLTQTIGLASGWYAIFTSGINQHYENIWFDGCSSLVGSNNLSFSTFKNLWNGRFEAGILDFAEWQNNVTVDGVFAHRIGANPSLNRIGISASNGSDVTFRNVYAFLGGWGRGASVFVVHRGLIEDCHFVGSGSASDATTEAILVGYGNQCFARRCTVEKQYKHGIQILSPGGGIIDCTVPATNAGFHAAYAPATLGEYTVTGNRFGVAGAYAPRDRFFQQTAQSPNARVFNNTGYVESLARKGGSNWAGSAGTSGATLTTLRTVALPGTTGVVRGYKVRAVGVRSGTASTKTVNLKLGATTIAQVNYAAPDTGAFVLEATINVRASTDAAHVHGRSWMGTTLQASTFQSIAAGLVSDVNLVVDAQCANAGDIVALLQMTVEPIMEQL